MDLYDTIKVLLTKIKDFDPENASRIMGYILYQGIGERDLLRLAFDPDTLLQPLIMKAKLELGLSSNTFSTLSLNPISRPSSSSSNSNNSQNQLPPLSPGLVPRNGLLEFSKKTPSWSPASSPKSSPFLSYENTNTDFMDENQMNEYLSFLDDSSSSTNEDFVGTHRKSFSASDACFGTGDEAGGYKPCLYYARGFCKNGDNCKFSHGRLGGLVDNGDVNGAIVGSPSEMVPLYHHQEEEMMRMRAAQQQRLAGASSPLPYEKNMNRLLQQQSDAQREAALMFGDEFSKFAHGRADRNDFLTMGLAEKAASKQIYLTFPPDSTFKEEDVSIYFSMFGPVQDVRIPYQPKRMFGFVTFVFPETVKLILSRGNPHFICDSRVLVKPHKEKGKVPDKRQPDLQQAIELQRRRFLNLQLPDFKNDGIHHHQQQRSLSVGSPISLPAYSHAGQNVHLTDRVNEEVSEVNGDNTAVAVPSIVNAAVLEELKSACVGNSQECSSPKGCHETSAEHALPDSLFDSPKKSTENHLSECPVLVESNDPSPPHHHH